MRGWANLGEHEMSERQPEVCEVAYAHGLAEKPGRVYKDDFEMILG